MTRRSGKGRKNGCDSSSAKDECGKVSAEAKNLNINAPDFTPHTHKYSVQSKYAQSLMGQHVDGKNEVKNILEDEFSEFKRLSLGESALKTSWESTLEIQCPTSAKSCMLVTPLTKGEATLSPQNNVTGGQRMIKNYGNVVSPQQFLHTRTESNHMPITNEYFGSLQVQSPDTAPSAHSSYASMQGHIIPNYPGFDTLQPATYEGIDDMDQRRYTAAQNNFLYKDATKNSNRTDIRSSPTKKCAEPIDGYIYQVQFKRAHKNFVLSPSAPTTIIPGDFVKVEADRGEDMGIVLSKTLARDFEEVMPTAGYRGRGFSSGQGERKFLYRLATVEERAALVKKVEDEEQALQVIQEKVVEQQLPMNILDAEYQFDRHKLTFFFEANRRIDFRELVSELFSLYKTRIWMQQVDTSVLGMHDAGTELARATGFLPSHMDCSEFGSGLFSMQVATQQIWSYPDRDFDLKRNGNIGIATPLDRAEQSLPSLPAVLGPLPSSGGPFAFQPFH